ncbi:MAG: 50S ribosomal protein L21e [Euryarchaeota archaeon]|jgi:large subunit ribosomal protein L21e|nr:50S ribosomal protein L21e [Euryarchaeota archaeon]MBP50474.1 50S ribosomal protein L21e [Euryarchaeota archaeon]|tara:strand:+ start:128 stop:421 length:294 start_codon:yes stop_codon:yes gene_type:complete
MATRTHGTRQGTRSILKKKKSEKGRVFINRVMHPYAEGDKVCIVLDGAQQRGMPHRRFQGLTGTIVQAQGKAFVVKVVQGNKEKTVVARPEHLRPAK